MTDYTTGPSSGRGAGTRMVTAMFDSRSDAEDAVRRLHAEGLSHDAVRLVPGHEADSDAGTSVGSGSERAGGFWDALADLFFPDEDRGTYAEGLSRGGCLVTVEVDQARYDRVIDILDDEGTIDLDERETEWRSEGWTGYAGSRGASSEGTRAGLASGSAEPVLGSGGMDAASGGSYRRESMDRGSEGADLGIAGTGALGSERSRSSEDRMRTGTSGAESGEQVIPLAEERLDVGKREVAGGRVRVRSYVVETPVEETVRLRREHVDVERRRVDRPVSSGEDAFRERTLEAEERSEQPVVSKETIIREEVALRKETDERDQTVSDTVRRTEVEIDDRRGADDRDDRRKM